MNKKFIFPILATLSLLWVFFFIIKTNPKPVSTPPPVLPTSVPFKHYIAGAGLCEPNSDIIAIGADISGVVRQVHVVAGQKIKKGQLLFSIEDRAAKDIIEQRKAQLLQAQADLATQEGLLKTLLAIDDPRAISKDELLTRKNAHLNAQAAVALQEASLKSAKTDLELRSIKSPIDGVVLTSQIRVGQFLAAANAANTPAMTVGNINPMHIRVDIDENDAWQFDSKTSAIAIVRGNPSLKTDLKFVRLEPYVKPKVSLTGQSLERVDTRVLQIIYSFNPKKLPIFAGQQMDIYIDIKQTQDNKSNSKDNKSK